MVARLFGLAPAPAGACRVLELGCGDGANVLAMAQTLPGSTFVGIDAAAGAVQRGRAIASAAGLDNVTLTAGDIERLPADLGSFDYIVAHGVYSWVPPRVRGALLSACSACLRSQGVAFISYNAYPGSYLRDMARDILAYHLRDVEDPAERLAGAHELMRTMVAIEDPSASARVLREQLQRTLNYSDALLVHDDLAEISTPFYFHEFIEHAEAHGLRFLSESELSDSQMHGVPDSVATLMASLPDDVIVREQYLDFFRNRMFRRTLLCHAGAAVTRALDDALLTSLWLSSSARRQEDGPGAPGAPGAATFVTDRGRTMTASGPLVHEAMAVFADAWPASVSFPELVARACERAGVVVDPPLADSLRAIMLRASLGGVVELRSHAPPLAAAPGLRPRASPLARAQGAAGLPTVSTLLHRNAALGDELDAGLLLLLDGTRDADALAAELGRPQPEVEAALERLAASGLLGADPAAV